jgi:hypothetical protein
LHDSPADLPYHANFETVTAPLWDNPKGRTVDWPGGIIGPLERGEVDLLFITSGDDGWINESVLKAMIGARRTQIVMIMHQMCVCPTSLGRSLRRLTTLPPVRTSGRSAKPSSRSLGKAD